MQEPLIGYRNDNVSGLPDEIRNFLDEHFLTHLENIVISNPKLLVVFSGGNGIGKSTLAHKIGKELHGLVLNNDAIKTEIMNYEPNISLSDLSKQTWQYSMNLYTRLNSITPNGFVVRDAVIDWYFDRILPIFEAQGYELFVVGFDISKPKRIRLIRNRGNTPTETAERLIEMDDEHQMRIARFRALYTPDVMLTDDNLFDHDQVIDLLRIRLERLRQVSH